jgi:uncharacterized membrane protein YkoI
VKRILKFVVVTLIVGAALMPPAFSQQAPSSGPRYTLDEAVALVKRKIDGRVLRAETLESDERTVYRIRILTADGNVKTINVDADKGIRD